MDLFAYGTLMWPEVMEAVIGLCPPAEPAVLHGYLRLRVKGEVYPAVVPCPADSVDGVLYRNLSPDAIRRLDAFEGDLYERLYLPVADTEAAVYALAPNRLHAAEDRPWHPEQFGPQVLKYFCAEYDGWSAR